MGVREDGIAVQAAAELSQLAGNIWLTRNNLV